MTRSQKQKAYREAAKRIAEEHSLYCCTSLEWYDEDGSLLDEFADYFKPASKPKSGPWFPDSGDWINGLNYIAQSQRILALYFMSHITK